MLLIKPKKNRKKGFTLIELMIVVAVLAILAAVAVPQIIGVTNRANQGVDIANASALAGTINTFNAMQSNSANWYTTSPVTWASALAKFGANSMPVITGGTGANLAAWQAKACTLITIDSATGVATVTTTIS